MFDLRAYPVIVAATCLCPTRRPQQAMLLQPAGKPVARPSKHPLLSQMLAMCHACPGRTTNISAAAAAVCVRANGLQMNLS